MRKRMTKATQWTILEDFDGAWVSVMFAPKAKGRSYRTALNHTRKYNNEIGPPQIARRSYSGDSDGVYRGADGGGYVGGLRRGTG